MKEKPFGKNVFVLFILFFAVIIGVNVFFVYKALHTNTGVVTDESYEKGLKYDSFLDTVKNQPKLQETFDYKDGQISWGLYDSNHKPIKNANVTAKFIRPVAEGHDISVSLKYISEGQYEGLVNLPLKGSWTVKLDAKWDKQRYQASYPLMAE